MVGTSGAVALSLSLSRRELNAVRRWSWDWLVDIVEVEAVIAAARPKAFEFRLAAGHAHHDIRAVGAWEAAQHKLFITALGYWPVPMLNGLGKVRLGASVGLKHMIGGNRGGAPEQAEHPGNDGMPRLVMSGTL